MVHTDSSLPKSSCEIILNLWYVRDEEGIIYSLRAKAYMAEGSEDYKLKFLQERARLDYLIAEPFEVPAPFHMVIGVGPESKKMPVGHIAMLPNILGAPLDLFEDAIRALDARLPSQSNVEIPEDPLCCVTALMQNESGVIEPRITGHVR